MLKRIWDKLTTSLRNVVAYRPVAMAGIGTVFLVAYQAATSDGLGIEDAAIAGAVAVLILLAQQLSYPAVKIDNVTGALKDQFLADLIAVETPLPPPFLGDEEEA